MITKVIPITVLFVAVFLTGAGMGQSNRYANLDLKEQDLIADGEHVLCAYIMKPKAGYGGYIDTAAHFAAESSTGTNVEVSTTDNFTRGVDAIVCEVDEARELMKISYPIELFDRNIIDGRAFESFPGDADGLFPNWRQELNIAA